MGNDDLLISIRADISGLDAGMKAAQAEIAGLKAQLARLGGAVPPVNENFNRLEGTMTSHIARLGAMELGMGHLSRMVGTVAREMGSLTTVIAIAGPVIAAVMAYKLYEYFEKLAAEAKKAAYELDDVRSKSIDSANAMQLQSLKLEDQIRKLEGRPEKNRLAIALKEAAIEADKLAGSLDKDIRKAEELLEKSHPLDAFLQGLADIGSKHTPQDIFASILGTAATRANEVEGVRTAIAEVTAAKKTMEAAPDGTPKHTEAVKALSTAYHNLAVSATNAMSLVSGRANDVGAKDRLNQLQTLADLADRGQKEQTAAIKEEEDARKRAGLETAKEAAAIALSLGEQRIKDEEAINKKIAAGDKQQADDDYKEAEKNIQKEVALHRGADRGQAELDAIPKYQAALKARTDAHIKAENDDYDAQEEALEKERVLVEKDTVGPERVKKLEHIASLLTEAQLVNSNNLDRIRDEGNTALLELDIKAAEARKKILDESDSDAEKSVRRTMEQSRQELQIAKETASEEEKAVTAKFRLEEDAVTSAEKRGLLAKQDAYTESVRLINAELSAKLDAIKKGTEGEIKALVAEQIAKVNAMASHLAAGGTATDPRYLEYLQQVENLQYQINLLQQKGNSDQHVAMSQAQLDLQKNKSALDEYKSSWSDFFAKWKVESQSMGLTIRTTLQNDLKQMSTDFGNAMGQCIVYGKNLGQAMAQMGGQMLSQFISMLTQMLLKWVITHIVMKVIGVSTQKAAAAMTIPTLVGLAGAGGVASMAAAPFPMDLTAPAFGASMAAAAAAYGAVGAAEQGGIIDNTGLHLLHTKEMVLPRNISEGMQSMFRGTNAPGAPAAGGGGDSHFHAHITAFDGEDVARTLSKHGPAFASAWHDQVRGGHVNLASAMRGK